jgi:hypothetical protein
MANYSGDTLDYGYRIRGNSTIFIIRDPLLDQEFSGRLSYGYRIRPDWSGDADSGTHYFDPASDRISYGYDIGGNYLGSPIKSVSILEYDYGIKGSLVRTTPGSFGFTQNVPEVMWSEIGSFDFEISKTNIAGSMQLGWDGVICKILQLGDQIIVYGSHGITALVPAKHGGYGKFQVSKIGIANPWAIDGSTAVHFFINANYEFCKLSKEGLQLMGYQEFMEGIGMTAVVTIDHLNELVYICDGRNRGYVYSIIDDCLSQGPYNITGAYDEGFGDGIYYVADGAIVWPDFGLKTDILDFGSRKYKTIHQVEVGFQSGDPETGITASTEFTLNVNVYSRSDTYLTDFISSPVIPTGPDGVADCRMFGKEFQIELSREDEADPLVDYFNIDWIRIRGIIHDYDPRDT